MVAIIGLIFLAFGLLVIGLQRLYSAVPLRELKRVAATRDHAASRLHMVAVYGENARLFLWTIAAASLAGGFVLLARAVPWPLAFVAVAGTLLLGLVWLPSIKLSKATCQFAVWLAPSLAWMLAHLQPVLQLLARLFKRFHQLEQHSRLYEKDDLQALLDQQQSQFDNRVPAAELERLKSTLHATDRHAAEIVVPRKNVRMVGAHESLGPVLIGELHKSGQAIVPVIDEKSQELVGILAMHDAVAHAKQSGHVLDVMRGELCFVHEDYDLFQTLEALLKTRQQLAVVVNGFGEFVGVIDLAALIGEITGTKASDDNAVNNLDRAAVAQFKPQAAKALEAQLEQSAGQTPAAADEVASPVPENASAPTLTELADVPAQLAEPLAEAQAELAAETNLSAEALPGVAETISPESLEVVE